MQNFIRKLSLPTRLTSLDSLINKIVISGVSQILKQYCKSSYIQKNWLFGATFILAEWLDPISFTTMLKTLAPSTAIASVLSWLTFSSKKSLEWTCARCGFSKTVRLATKPTKLKRKFSNRIFSKKRPSQLAATFAGFTTARLFPCGYVKSMVYSNKQATHDELREHWTFNWPNKAECFLERHGKLSFSYSVLTALARRSYELYWVP